MIARNILTGACLTAVVLFSTTIAATESELVVYSARKEHLIKPLFDAYTAKTGTRIRFITDKAGPLQVRLMAEGARTPADLLITVDAGNLWRAADVGLLAPIDSPVLQANIPARFRDPQNRWFGLSVRARTVVYNTERVKLAALSTYEALGDPKWKGRLCLRTSKKVYNQSLVAMMIARLGKKQTAKVVRSWVDNLATTPFSSDTWVMKAIAAGQCDVGIVNTYYYGRLMKKDPSLPLALFWPNQGGSGVHVNVSGAGVTRYAKHPQEAVRFLEWASSEQAQRLFADANMEYPVNPRVKPDPQVGAWGEFKQDSINLSQAGKLQPEAVMLMDRVGYK
ncbi:MAG: extracellular solute-binding protein [Gammaproteobacteria bacterium]|nr:MAG: extracellular solute-binding protein [Gammaproteobacteria bacterium]